MKAKQLKRFYWIQTIKIQLRNTTADYMNQHLIWNSFFSCMGLAGTNITPKITEGRRAHHNVFDSVF